MMPVLASMTLQITAGMGPLVASLIWLLADFASVVVRMMLMTQTLFYGQYGYI